MDTSVLQKAGIVAVLLNTAMYFLGFQAITLNRLTVNMYDLLVLTFAMVLFGFFCNTAWQETRRLAALGK